MTNEYWYSTGYKEFLEPSITNGLRGDNTIDNIIQNIKKSIEESSLNEFDKILCLRYINAKLG